MNRILKIILTLIAVFFLILGIIWLIGRNKAIKNGAAPLTFRQFLGLSTKKDAAAILPGEGTSQFNADGTPKNNNGSTTGANGFGGDGTIDTSGLGGIGIGGTGNVNISNFTNGTTSLAGSFGANNPITGNGSGANGSTGTGANGSNNNSGGDANSPGNSNAGSASVCSDDDITIPFTADQLAQLNILQSRFYTLAQTLHNDTDVETELANHDAFKNKADSILELYAYCESKLPAINSNGANDPRLKLHIATPFWRSYYNNPEIAAYVKNKTGVTIPTSDPAQDSLSFLTFSGYGLAHTTAVHDNNDDNPEVPLPAHGIDQLLPGVSLIRGPYGLVTFSSPQSVPTTGSSLGDLDIIAPVTEKFLRINLW
ncbi:MAG: hypothetical protein ABIO57_00860 [Candidatus Paceibacterota bacterium]